LWMPLWTATRLPSSHSGRPAAARRTPFAVPGMTQGAACCLRACAPRRAAQLAQLTALCQTCRPPRGQHGAVQDSHPHATPCRLGCLHEGQAYELGEPHPDDGLLTRCLAHAYRCAPVRQLQPACTSPDHIIAGWQRQLQCAACMCSPRAWPQRLPGARPTGAAAASV
jgi:hypothetical protein